MTFGWVFVACLPWSQRTFAEAFPDMGEESWVTAHVHAFSFFGGSTPILVPDNCKAGVVKNTVEELIINEQYRRMAEHYGCAVVPARPRRPRDKGFMFIFLGWRQCPHLSFGKMNKTRPLFICQPLYSARFSLRFW